MPNSNPIGIFDSGIGGLSVLREVQRILPNENIIYLGDNLNMPYGSKNIAAVRVLVKESIKFLLKNKAKVIIPACNTIAATSLETITKMTNVPIINIINQVVRAAIKDKVTSCAIMGTPLTINSGIYKKKLDAVGISSTPISCPNLAYEIEINKETTLPNIQEKCVILGCTHYSFIKDKFVGRKIIDPAYAIAQSLYRFLERTDNLNVDIGGKTSCYFTGALKNVETFATKFQICAQKIEGGK